MKKIIVICFCMFFSVSVYAEIKTDFTLFNRAFVYNAENTHWEDTQVTLTYFENFTQGVFGFYFNDFVSLHIGASVFVPFSLELPDGIRFFPIVTSKISNEYVMLTIGTLDQPHNFPATILDPLIGLTPYIRASENNMRMNNGPEQYKYGKFTHGFYEYGLSFKWFEGGTGEVYINWQLMHTPKHRERFDIGLTYALDFVNDIATPYIGLHYWHNGGQEYPFVAGAPKLTENYVANVGLHSDALSILYLLSYDIPDRDMKPSSNQFGMGFYFRGKISVFDYFSIEPSVFVSGYYIKTSWKYVSAEADPFFRTPFYFGLNVIRDFKITEDIVIGLLFVNGIFLTERNEIGLRYDQSLRFDFKYNIELGRKKVSSSTKTDPVKKENTSKKDKELYDIDW